MKRSVSLRRFAVAAVALSLVASACGGSRDKETATTKPANNGSNGGATTGGIDTSACTEDPTVELSGDTIKLGMSVPQTTIYSAFDEIRLGADSFFQYTNANGGVTVNGKKYKIELVAKDDQYDAAKTITNVDSLINDDKVFGLFSVVGTKNNQAIRDDISSACVPDLFAATGAPLWGNNDYPWVLGTELVPYPLEMKAFADYLAKTKPDAKVAILAANDDFGRSYTESFQKAIAGTKITVAATQTYNIEAPDTKAQITSLAASNADAFILGATLTACPQALSNLAGTSWKPIVYMSGTCTSKTLMALAGAAGDKVLSVAPLLDPADPANAANANYKVYAEQVKKYQPKAELDNGIVAFGWTTAAIMTEVLSKSPKLTRLDVMNTARNFSVEGLGLMLDGQKFSTSKDDWFLGETFNLVAYDLAAKFFKKVEGPIDFSGKTASLTPEKLLNS